MNVSLIIPERASASFAQPQVRALLQNRRASLLTFSGERSKVLNYLVGDLTSSPTSAYTCTYFPEHTHTYAMYVHVSLDEVVCKLLH
jgi:hypothetical protein